MEDETHSKKKKDTKSGPRRAVDSLRDPREQLNAVVERLREDPEEFTELRRLFHTAKTDEQRVELLLGFAVTDEELTRLVPGGIGRPGDQLAATVTTVTVTTVTIPDTAY